MRLVMVNYLLQKSKKPGNMVSFNKNKQFHLNLKILGSTVQYDLVWSRDKNLPDWDAEKLVVLETGSLPASKEKRACNTRKDKDKRQNRHTCGIFIG